MRNSNAIWKIKVLVDWEDDNSREDITVSAFSFEEAVQKAKRHLRACYKMPGKTLDISIEYVVRDSFLDA